MQCAACKKCYPRRVIARRAALPSLMIATVAIVAALAWLDQREESSAAFDELAAQQATLARTVAAATHERMPEVARAATTEGESLVLLLAPDAKQLVDVTGRALDQPQLVDALRSGATSFVLSRPAAASLGLPERTAIAGLAHTGDGWGVVVASTARAVRDREMRGRTRLLSSVLVAAGLVWIFGSIALRTQRKELELERALALADAQRKGDERLSRAGRVAMMGTLASGVAHEISTPLGVISGRAEQLEARVNDDERASKHVQTILEQTKRIEEVVRGFLDLARGEAPALRRVEPASIVDGAVKLVRHRFEKAGVALEAIAARDLPSLNGDVRLLEHALVNLLLNACEACARDGHVTLEAARRDESVCFEVVDDGAGIDAEAAARAFEPFFTTKPVGKGTGLGLAITHEIVKAHHGTLSLAPNAPKGTRAVMIIPTAPAKPSNRGHIDAVA